MMALVYSLIIAILDIDIPLIDYAALRLQFAAF